MTQNFPDNTLHELDNLDVLRRMNSETVHLIATDPRVNAKTESERDRRTLSRQMEIGRYRNPA